MKEVEVKLKLPGRSFPKYIFSRLQEANARFIGKDYERNLVLDSKEDGLKKKGCLLRVRERHGKEHAILTFKGPIEEPHLAGIKVREEIEVPVQNSHNTLKILRGCGFAVKKEYSKQRWNFELKGINIQLDKIPHLGYFLEIEGHDERKVNSMIVLLKLGGLKRVSESYSEMV